MDKIQTFRALVNERLSVAVEEIFAVFEKTVITYEEEINRQRKLLDMVSATGADSRHVFVCEEGPPCKQEHPKSPQLKVEPEELWTGQGGAELQGLPETNVSFKSTPSPIMREMNSDEKPCSLFNQIQTEDSGKEDPIPSTSTGQIKTEPFQEECAASQPDRNIELVDCGKEQGKKERCLRQNADKKIFSCAICGQAFIRKGHLDVHMRYHTGEKPFCCTYCGVSFGRKAILKAHTRRHTGEKPFSCTICGQKFSQNSTMHMHMRSHTGEKPFGCPGCDKMFTRRSCVRRHMTYHCKAYI